MSDLRTIADRLENLTVIGAAHPEWIRKILEADDEIARLRKVEQAAMELQQAVLNQGEGYTTFREMGGRCGPAWRKLTNAINEGPQ